VSDTVTHPLTWQTDPALGLLPVQLCECIENLLLPAGLVVTHAPQREAESADYGACRLSVNHQTVVFRVARTTPTKVGQFVTLWQRPGGVNEIAPLDSEQGIAAVMVAVFDEENRGIFLFDGDILVKQGVFSRQGVGGKRALRVYAPWVTPLSRQALKTQQWQSRYFYPLHSEYSAGGDVWQGLNRENRGS